MAAELALRNVPQLRPDQSKIALALDEYETIVCSMGRRWGKTVLGLALVLAALLSGMRVAWVVPVYRNSNPLWRALRHAISPLVALRRARVNQAERFVETWNGGFVQIYSADNIDAMRGEWFHLVVVDEAARVTEEAYTDAIQPTIADVGGKVVLISTPKRKNWFYRLWRMGQERQHGVISFTAPTTANPNPLIRRAARRAALVVPDITYRQEWLGEFVDDGLSIWSREWAQYRYSIHDKAMTNRVVGRFLSYDTGNKDKDTNAYSSLVVGELLRDYRMRIRHVWRNRLLLPNLIERVERDIVRWDKDKKLQRVIIEDKASGTSLYQTLMASGSDELQAMLIPFMPTGSKEQRFDQAGVWVKNGSIILPEPDDSLAWLYPYEEEVFEESEYKDQRDASAQLVIYAEPLLRAGLRLRTRASEEAA
jgi:predicted phage terminase large subunit-like protein